MAPRLHSLAKTKADRDHEESARDEMMEEMQEPEGIEMHLDHHHMQKMGMKEPPASGSEVEFHGRGHVVSSESRDVGGTTRHHMRIRLTHGAIEHDEEPDHGSLRRELAKNAG